MWIRDQMQHLNHLLLLVGDDAGNVFVELSFMLFRNKRLASFDEKNDVYVELGVGVRHSCFSN